MPINTQKFLQITLKQALRTSRYYSKIGRGFFMSRHFEDLLDFLLHYKNERPKKSRSKNHAKRQQRIKAKLKRVAFLYRKELLSGTVFILRPRVSTAFTLAVSALGYFEFFKMDDL